MGLIEPRTLKGFRDYLPAAMIPRERLIETARKIYRSYGFSPIDTPALEYEEILTGKGGEESDKQLYAFEDNGGRRVALRFDLTVPLARFVAQHSSELGLPFKRYHIATVWRGENTQRGRYREFMQCDFDTIGSESLTVDIEAVLVIADLLRAIEIEFRESGKGFGGIKISVNNRKVLTGIVASVGIGDRAGGALRAIDKLQKIGPQQVVDEIVAGGYATAQQASRILDLLQLARGESNEAALEMAGTLVKGNPSAEQGLHEIEELLRSTAAEGALAPGVTIKFDPWIARGLDYYTGTVFETSLGALPSIGSVCSGGRYDDLAQLYTKQRLPGVGASLGLDRLLAAMEELAMIEKRSASAPVFMPWFAPAHLDDYLRLAARLRRAGIGVEFYPECKKLGVQLKYADRRGFPVALIVGDEEWSENRCQLKDLASGENSSHVLEFPDQSLDPTLLERLSELRGVR